MCRPGASASYPAPRPDSLHQGPGLYMACVTREPWKLMITKPFRIGKGQVVRMARHPLGTFVMSLSERQQQHGKKTVLFYARVIVYCCVCSLNNVTEPEIVEKGSRGQQLARNNAIVYLSDQRWLAARIVGIMLTALSAVRVRECCTAAAAVVVVLSRLSKSSELKLMYVDSRPGGTETREPIKWPST